MKNTVLCICGLIMSVVLMAEERPKTDWGYIKATLESNDAFYVKDAANGFDPADYPYLDGILGYRSPTSTGYPAIVRVSGRDRLYPRQSSFCDSYQGYQAEL